MKLTEIVITLLDYFSEFDTVRSLLFGALCNRNNFLSLFKLLSYFLF